LNPGVTIYGIDINPLSILATLTNFIVLLKGIDDTERPEIHLINADALLIDSNDNKSSENEVLSLLKTKKVDFIIGNPPWINISGIYRREYKEHLKSLARKMRILFNAESKNTEICTIFFNQSRDMYLKKGGEIFFILPASVLNGRQHGYFRYFPNFINIEVWRFTQDIFKIHSICLYAQNAESNINDLDDMVLIKKRLNLSSTLFEIQENINIVETEEKSPLVPIYIKFVKNNTYPLVGRFNPLSMVPESLHNIAPQKSVYYKKVRGGLRIVPRRWVVIRERPPFEDITTIHPDLKQQAKPQWADPPYSEEKVESQYINAFLKSKFLIPFTFVNIQYAFIPIRSTLSAIKDRNVINTTRLKPNASNLYRLLDLEYRKRIKKSASMKTLADNFTYNKRLLPTNVMLRRSQVMVVHNSIGSIVKSAIIREPLLLDNSLYYVIMDDLDEAYYLCGILNSSVITGLVRLIGSTGSRGSLRNIHKNPYNFPIPPFSGSKIQMDIVNLSRKLEKHVQGLVFDISKSDNLNLAEIIKSKKSDRGPRTIQKSIFNDVIYKEWMTKLNVLVRNTLLSEKFSS
jgi:hypothetical protein